MNESVPFIYNCRQYFVKKALKFASSFDGKRTGIISHVSL
jgi:hypothetical protein